LVNLFLAPDSGSGLGLALFGTFLSASSIALITLTLGIHKAPPSQWHQENDAPQELVTRGPYSRIRHPFYSGYLLAFLAAVCICPTAGTVGVFIYAGLILNHTAAREEQRLRASEFGTEYRAYMERTGRFLPRKRRQ
jgi:protein-S-isoprenylcysteine O-methyltransferase Ste14